MSTYIGSEPGGNKVMHLSSSIESEDDLATNNVLSSTVFHSNSRNVNFTTKEESLRATYENYGSFGWADFYLSPYITTLKDQGFFLMFLFYLPTEAKYATYVPNHFGVTYFRKWTNPSTGEYVYRVGINFDVAKEVPSKLVTLVFDWKVLDTHFISSVDSIYIDSNGITVNDSNIFDKPYLCFSATGNTVDDKFLLRETNDYIVPLGSSVAWGDGMEADFSIPEIRRLSGASYEKFIYADVTPSYVSYYEDFNNVVVSADNRISQEATYAISIALPSLDYTRIFLSLSYTPMAPPSSFNPRPLTLVLEKNTAVLAVMSYTAPDGNYGRLKVGLTNSNSRVYIEYEEKLGGTIIDLQDTTIGGSILLIK